MIQLVVSAHVLRSPSSLARCEFIGVRLDRLDFDARSSCDKGRFTLDGASRPFGFCTGYVSRAAQAAVNAHIQQGWPPTLGMASAVPQDAHCLPPHMRLIVCADRRGVLQSFVVDLSA